MLYLCEEKALDKAMEKLIDMMKRQQRALHSQLSNFE